MLCIVELSSALLGVQVAPPSVLLKNPLLSVPAYTVAGVTGSTARAVTNPTFSDVGDHDAPPLVLLKTPVLRVPK